MGRIPVALLLCALACAFAAGLALASAGAVRGAGDGVTTTDTSSDSLPDDGQVPTPAVAQPPRGAAVVGRRLTVPPVLAGSVHYQWQACRKARCTAIEGATRATLLLTKTLVGRTVRVMATTDAGVVITSKPSAPVRAAR
ncbi:MAG TPA: hypothetical protein VHC67_06930 [Gaiellaceae bacterium]|nr:hypothetical protein [Gaiellaceae bacterium]